MRAVLVAFAALVLAGCASAPLALPGARCVDRLPYVGGPVVAGGREQSGSTYKAVSLGLCASLQDVRQA